MNDLSVRRGMNALRSLLSCSGPHTLGVLIFRLPLIVAVQVGCMFLPARAPCIAVRVQQTCRADGATRVFQQGRCPLVLGGIVACTVLSFSLAA